MNIKQTKPRCKSDILVCKNTFKQSTEAEKSKTFTEKWITIVAECEKRKLLN